MFNMIRTTAAPADCNSNSDVPDRYYMTHLMLVSYDNVCVIQQKKRSLVRVRIRILAQSTGHARKKREYDGSSWFLTCEKVRQTNFSIKAPDILILLRIPVCLSSYKYLVSSRARVYTTDQLGTWYLVVLRACTYSNAPRNVGCIRSTDTKTATRHQVTT